MTAASLASAFERYFDIVPADTPGLLERAFRLRGDVYCKEFGYEREEDCPNGLECDEFDRWSKHCLVQHVGTGRTAGCVRVVEPPSGDPKALLPLQMYCAASLWSGPLHPHANPKESLCEVSRLAVHGDFRRRQGESKSPLGDMEALADQELEQRSYPLISVALFLAATALVVRGGRSHVYAMMEPRLARLLRRSGLAFEQVGGTIDYHGKRAAFHIHIDAALSGMEQALLQLYRNLARRLGADPSPRIGTCLANDEG